MNKTKIEWTDYTWNPLIGCKKGCPYCYGRRMNNRFKWIPKWDKPKFFPGRLKEPYANLKITESLIDRRRNKGWKGEELNGPIRIFVCSISELFGDWVPKSRINNVLLVAERNPKYIFQFLTKNPKRYLEFDSPENCWLGATIDGTEDYGTAQSKINQVKLTNNYKFISFEPLLGNVSELDLTGIDLVIIGAQTGPGAIKPKKKWIKSIKHPNIFWKDNIKKYF